MALYSIKHIQKKLMTLFNGGEYTVYLKIKNLMDGYVGNSNKREVQALRSFLKKNYEEIDKKLTKIENEF